VNSRTTESYDVITGWMSDEETSDLMELFNSTDVYVIENSNTIPVIITNSSYDEKNVKNNRLYNYVISYDASYEKLSNR
jgi:ketopantoate hydroxymethyltransferase